jgi:shikimate dehydrogenase
LPSEIVARAHAALPAQPAYKGGHRLVALLGDPVQHSLSPAMQNAAFAAGGDALLYVAVRAPKARLGRVVQGLREACFAGANVTHPHKETILEHVDRVDARAQEARSANTLVARAGKLIAHTTDGDGAVAALREAGAEVEDAVALVLGAGGTSRSVAFALRRAGARVLVANRSPAKARALARAAGAEAIALRPAALRTVARRSTLVVNGTTLGSDGRSMPVPAEALHAGLVVLDAVYRPGSTPLVRAARAAGALALPGQALLLHQGALAYTHWTGKPAPLAAMRRALEEA